MLRRRGLHTFQFHQIAQADRHTAKFDPLDIFEWNFLLKMHFRHHFDQISHRSRLLKLSGVL